MCVDTSQLQYKQFVCVVMTARKRKSQCQQQQRGGKLNVYRSRATMQRGYGGNIPVFSAQPFQRGHGFGGLFRGLLRTIAPIAKRGLLSVGKAALNAGARALEDARDNNTSMKQALKKQAVETFHPTNVINRAVKKRKASSRPTQPARKVPRTSKAPKKSITDAPRLPR